MRNSLNVLLVASLFLASCGNWGTSNANPRNWFGKSRTVAVSVPEEAVATNPLVPKRRSLFKRPEPVDSSVAIASVTELRVERTTTGAIIRATGVSARQGAYNTELRPDPPGKDTPANVLSLTFRVVYPKDPTAVGSKHTRTINEAYSLSNQDLRGIRLIRVKGAQNALETRRR